MSSVMEIMFIKAIERQPVPDLGTTDLVILGQDGFGRGVVDPHDPLTAEILALALDWTEAHDTAVQVVWSSSLDVVMCHCARCTRLDPLTWLRPSPGGLMCHACMRATADVRTGMVTNPAAVLDRA